MRLNTISNLYLRFVFMRSSYILFLLLVFVLSSLFSCKKDKLKAPESSFLIVNNVRVKTKKINPNQGSEGHNITDMWYYVNGNFKGVFPVGSVMPIVATGNVEITLFAGIKNNGISDTRVPYPPYSQITFTLNIEPGKTYTYSPEFTYNSTAFFYYADDFDGSGSYFNSDINYNCVVTHNPSKTFGNTGGSYYMTMYDTANVARLIQTSQYFLPNSGAVIYVEMDYKCNQTLTAGLFAENSTWLPILNITPTSEWKKIYIQLTNTVSSSTYANFRFYIEATKEVANPEIYIDNIKLIYQ